MMNACKTVWHQAQWREWLTSWLLLEGQEQLMIIAFIEHILCARLHPKDIHILTNIQMHEQVPLLSPEE